MAATQIRSDLEHLFEIFESRVPELEQLDERFESRGAASGNPDQEQLNDGLATREALRTVYRDYIRTRQRTIDLKDELRITRGLYLGLIQAHQEH